MKILCFCIWQVWSSRVILSTCPVVCWQTAVAQLVLILMWAVARLNCRKTQRWLVVLIRVNISKIRMGHSRGDAFFYGFLWEEGLWYGRAFRMRWLFRESPFKCHTAWRVIICEQNNKGEWVEPAYAEVWVLLSGNWHYFSKKCMYWSHIGFY